MPLTFPSLKALRSSLDRRSRKNTRCSRCRSLTIGALRQGDYALQPSLAALKASAEGGCDFCMLLWTALLRNNPKAVIEAHVKQPKGKNVLVSAELHDGPNLEDRTLELPKISVGVGDSGHLPPCNTSYLHVYAKTDDPAARYIGGREVLGDPAADVTFQRIRTWMGICDKEHVCLESLEAELPTRYIDVGPADGSVEPFLCINRDARRGLYTTLSYVWGSDQPTVTTRDNLNALQQGIKLSELSKTIQDAILVTRKLKLRFLWVDALCIIQQEPNMEDFLNESLKMAIYYTNAYLTICASVGSADNGQGFLSPRPKPLAEPCSLKYSQGQQRRHLATKSHSGMIYAGLESGSAVGHLQTRAWAYQEVELSPRVLIYGSEQVFIACLRRRELENGLLELFTAFPRHSRSVVTIGRFSDDKESAKSRMLHRWYIVVSRYTLRHLTKPNDKLTALAGVAEYAERSIQSHYMFGLWAENLVHGLQWTANSSLARRPSDPRAPSWSWASLDGPISYWDVMEEDNKSPNKTNELIELVTHRIPPKTFDPIRTACFFELTVKGTVKAVRNLHEVSHEFEENNELYEASVPQWAMTDELDGFLLGPANEDLDASAGKAASDGFGFGVYDAPAVDTTPDVMYALPSLPNQGLLLVEAENGKFRRIGKFWTEQEDWMRGGEARLITLI